MISLSDFLKSLDLERFTSVFVENEVDLETLRVLSEDDLKELGLPFGPRKRLLSATSRLNSGGALSQADAAGERRQVTVLFCDMVGYTELARRVDPEVLQRVVRTYEDQCARCVSRYGGYVFQRLGDGIVAFFGYPLAHEAEAERAIRAGLDILESIARTDSRDIGRVRVRIGIATGIVLVSSAEQRAVGETMNLAARLQAIAAPDSLVVSARVHRLAGGAFEYQDLGEFALKGIESPMRAYRVVGAGSAESRFEAATRSGVMPLIGREAELALLEERWGLVRQRAGQVVLISGEAGIGKSRLLNAMRESVQRENVTLFRFQCSPFYVNSAYHPIISSFDRALGFARDESAESKLDKIEKLIVHDCRLPAQDARFLALMLSVPSEARYGATKMSPQLVKAETARVLVEILAARVQEQPGLLLFEDIHWADPTSLEVLEKVLARAAGCQLFVILTHRPEFQAPWTANDYTSRLHLTRLTPAESGTLISRLTNGKPLPVEVFQQIVARADGVPLYVEEITKAILGSGDLVDEGERYAYRGSASAVPIPEALRDSLTARLDRVPAAKEVAQVGAVIGREFSYELLAALNIMPEQALDRALARLIDSELVWHTGSLHEGSFTFKHALLQDAAYDSLVTSRRQTFHGKIAAALEERWPDTRETHPELLGHHFTAAANPAKAIPYWQSAGKIAMERFAVSEAASHLRTGLELVSKVPSSPDRDLMELRMRTALAPAVVAQRGWGHSEVSAILEPAWALAESLEYRPAYLPILSTLWVYYMCTAQLSTSLMWAEKLLSIGSSIGDDSLEIVGHRAAAASYYWLGDFQSASRHGATLRSMYDIERHWPVAQFTNFDPLTGEGVYRGQILWMMGYPDQAAADSDAKDEHARKRNHAFDLAMALTLGAQVFDHRSEPHELLRRAEQAERIGREHGLPLLWEIMAEISRGIALLRAGQASESAEQLGRTVARLAATGHRIWIDYLNALRAEGLALSGDIESASALIEECAARMFEGQERAHYAEVLRLRGWILSRQGRFEEAERSLDAAIEVAQSQSAKGWELRAATTLSRLLMERGERARAYELLRPVYDWFTEGFETKDLREARAILESLECESTTHSHKEAEARHALFETSR